MTRNAVLLFSCDSIPDDIIRERYAGWDILTPHQVKSWVRDGSVHSRFRRYDTVQLHAPSLAGSTPPLLAGAAAIFLGRRTALADNESAREPFGLGPWLGIVLRHLADGLSLPGKLREIGRRLDRLESAVAVRKRPRLDLAKGAPVYLRSDLIYGLHAGGSVGHIAGVVNNLESCSARPHFFTTAAIPTVREDIPCTIVAPEDKRYWTHREMSALCFSETFTARVAEGVAPDRTSFIYQRYCLNNTSGLELSLRCGVPFVLEYNGSEVWISRHWGQPLHREALSLRIERLNLEAADCIVVVSEALRDTLAEQGVAPGKILVNPNGVDTGVYRPDRSGAKVRERLSLDGKTVIGFIGSFGRWHGAEVLAEAFGLMLRARPELADELRLLFIGDGLMRAEAEAVVQRHGVAGQVTFTGIVPQAEGPELLAACDILASPHVPNPDGTPFFGSPTKLFEYMAMGRGIAASDLDQIGQVLEHGRTALLSQPGDAAALADNLLALCDDPDLRGRLGRAARERALREHGWDRHVERIMDKLSILCNET